MGPLVLCAVFGALTVAVVVPKIHLTNSKSCKSPFHRGPVAHQIYLFWVRGWVGLETVRSEHLPSGQFSSPLSGGTLV